MSGFNMPPGVSPGDIPGNGPDDDTTERITDECLKHVLGWLNNMPEADPPFGGASNPTIGALARDLQDARARVRELDEQMLIYMCNSKEYFDKYNALREAVLKFDRTKSYIEGSGGISDDGECYGDMIKLTEGGGESVAKSQEDVGTESPALKRKPKAYLTRHDTEGGGEHEKNANDSAGSLSPAGDDRPALESCTDNAEPSTRPDDTSTASTDEEPKEPALDCTACSGRGECWSTLVNKVVPCPYCNGTGKEPKE